MDAWVKTTSPGGGFNICWSALQLRCPRGLHGIFRTTIPSRARRLRGRTTALCSTLEISAFDPDLVAVSMRNIDNTDALDPQGFLDHYRQLTRAVRRISTAPIVLGGTGFTLFAREAMQLLGADYGISGEGERLAALLQALEKREDPAGMPGIIVGDASVPAPDPWSGAVARRFDPQAPFIDFYLRDGGMLNLQTKRGCPFRCIYCSYPYIEGRTLRYEPPAHIARTAVELQNAGAQYLFITDSAFNADIAHSLAVAHAFKKEGLTIPWGGFFAPVPAPPDYFPILADCGLKHVEFGTESLSDIMLAGYRKPFTVRHVFDAHRAANAADLHVAHYFLFGGPGEMAKTLDESFSLMDRLERTVLFLFCGMRIYPHTSLYEIALQEGQVLPGQSILEPVFYQPFFNEPEGNSPPSGGALRWKGRTGCGVQAANGRAGY